MLPYFKSTYVLNQALCIYSIPGSQVSTTPAVNNKLLISIPSLALPKLLDGTCSPSEALIYFKAALFTISLHINRHMDLSSRIRTHSTWCSLSTLSSKLLSLPSTVPSNANSSVKLYLLMLT